MANTTTALIQTGTATVAPFTGPFAPVVIGVGALAGVFTSLFRGRNEIESFNEDIVPVIKPYILETGLPVGLCHYGFIWVLEPNGNIISLTGEKNFDDDNARVPCIEGTSYLQRYANETGNAVAELEGFTGGKYLSGNPIIGIIYPEGVSGFDDRIEKLLKENPKQFFIYVAAGIAGLFILKWVLS